MRRARSSFNRLFVVVAMFLPLSLQPAPAQAGDAGGNLFKRTPTQYIAVLGDPQASSGDGAQHWGLWELDPGPRGVHLANYELLVADGGVAPAKWRFDGDDWWLEENGLIMESPDFPLPAGRYLVTGNRETIAVLTVHAADADGNMRWELDRGANLYDVTHLGCRSARYTPLSGTGSCSPKRAPQSAFRVTPDDDMPEVEGCDKQDYAVLIVIGVGI